MKLTPQQKIEAFEAAAALLSAWQEIGPADDDMTEEQIDFISRDVARILMSKAIQMRRKLSTVNW